MMSTPAKRTTVYLDPDLHKALRLKAVAVSRSVSDLINEAVRESLKKEKNKYRGPTNLSKRGAGGRISKRLDFQLKLSIYSNHGVIFPGEVTMKRALWPLVVLLLITLIVVMAGCDSITSPGIRSTTAGTSGQNTGIWVTGEGKVTVVPDIAVLSVGVEAQADTVEKAQSDASGAMSAVKSELDARGIDAKDIKTRYFSISPVMNYVPDKGSQELVGYLVTNMLTVKVRKVEDTGAIIDAVAKAGGDFIRIDSISFTVDDPTPYQKQAREKALADARDKAKQIADGASLKLGAPTYINETGSNYPYPVTVDYESKVAGGGTSISPGETTVTVTLQVAYAIK
jgi:uncharacterized protein YggE